MPKCPECGEEIDHLVESEAGLVEYEVEIIGESMEFGEGRVVDSLGDDQTYSCPSCSSDLGFGYEEAEAFLKYGITPDDD